MAEEVISCENLDEVYVPDWDSVVGEKTLEDGGKVGDLLLLTRAHLKDAKRKGEVTERMAGEVYSAAITEAIRSAITFELGAPKARVETCLLKAQIDAIRSGITRDDCKAEAECGLTKAQTDKVVYETDNVLPKEVEKLEATVDNIEATTTEIGVASERDDCRAQADCDLKAQQIDKSKCDCANSTMLNTAQTALYNRQTEGFDDNAKQKLYDTQIQAWAMVFADTSLESVTPSISTPHITDTFNNLSERLGNKFKAPLLDYGEGDAMPDKLKFNYVGTTNTYDITRFKKDTYPLQTILSLYDSTESNDDITFTLVVDISGDTISTDGDVDGDKVNFTIDDDAVDVATEGTYSIKGVKDDETIVYASGKFIVVDDAI